MRVLSPQFDWSDIETSVVVPVQNGYDNKLVIPLTVCLSCTCGFTFILYTALALSSSHVLLMYALSFTDIGASAQWTLQWNPELNLRTLLSSTQSQTALRKMLYTTWTPLVSCVHPILHRVPSQLLPWQHHGWLSTGLSPPQPSLLATRPSPLATREPCRLKYICVPWPPPLQRLSLCHGCPTTRSSVTSSQAGRQKVSHRPPSHLTWNLRLRLQQPMNPRRLRFNLPPFFYCNQD